MNNIKEVLDTLDDIIEQCICDSNPVGAFAALYRCVTAKVKEGIEKGRFENGPRMEKLDIVFAQRFIDAWFAYARNPAVGGITTASWLVAFEASKLKEVYHLQHVFLGMNAHINLDLGIAAASVAPGDQLADLKNDFMEINVLLAEMTEVVQVKLSGLSPILGYLDRVARQRDEQIAGFSLSKARDHAWNVANLLAPIPEDHWPPVISAVDEQIARLGRLIIRPSGSLWRKTFRIVHFLEGKTTVGVIERLRGD